THIILSVIVIPFVLVTYVRAITNQVELHKKIARFTFPLWLYVAVTGVVVYVMISPYYSPNPCLAGRQARRGSLIMEDQ
ncbi:MAG: DUF420 domain-containing protein, partial [Lutibacter sp.]|nr:DUF420 domain-containing protein [Lutibacter sp.]